MLSAEAVIFYAVDNLAVALFCRFNHSRADDEKNCIERKNLSIDHFSGSLIVRHSVARVANVVDRFAWVGRRPQTDAFNV